MKNILLVIFSILTLWSCDDNTNTEIKKESKAETIKTAESFDWLIGDWKRNNDEEGRTTYETWYKNGNNSYLGYGFAMSNGDTISKENMKIEKLNNKWRLEVFTKEDTVSTYFNITKLENNSFTCENNEIDFPNKIQYWKDGEKIKATVSSSDFKIDFEFDRLTK